VTTVTTRITSNHRRLEPQPRCATPRREFHNETWPPANAPDVALPGLGNEAVSQILNGV